MFSHECLLLKDYVVVINSGYRGTVFLSDVIPIYIFRYSTILLIATLQNSAFWILNCDAAVALAAVAKVC